MSELTIKDGTGTGSRARVNNINRLEVDSNSLGQHPFQIQRGNGYFICTGGITLTSADESALLYFKNEGVETIHVNAIYFGQDDSTGGSGTTLVKTLANPTTIDFSTAISPTNAQIGNLTTYDVTVYKGVEGSSYTGGDFLFCYVNDRSAMDKIRDDLALSIRPGNSILLTVEPATGNTSQAVYLGFDYHVDINEVI